MGLLSVSKDRHSPTKYLVFLPTLHSNHCFTIFLEHCNIREFGQLGRSSTFLIYQVVGDDLKHEDVIDHETGSSLQ